jgi:hypothetical protein
MSKNTKEKYYNFMMSMYNAQEFDIRKLMKEHKVSTRIATLLRERRVIAKYGKLTRWVGDMPTQAMANAYAKESLRVARISKMHVAVIIFRFFCKMLLIMAAGAILGFLIATIIWK